MVISVYGLKTCDTCRKALKALEAAGASVSFVDIRAEANLSIKVPEWLATTGPDILVNRRSTTWRNLTEDERGTPPEPLLIAHPTLIKRPVIEADGTVHVGWTRAVEDTLL